MLRLSFLAATLILISVPVIGQTAADELAAGRDAYRSGDYDAAAQHLQKVIALSPELTVAHLYLGICYAQQYIPGTDTPEDVAIGEHGVNEFKLVVSSNAPSDQKVAALRGMSSLLFDMKRFEPAKEAYSQLIDLVPDEATSYYQIAVIDWTQSYTPRMELRASMDLQPTDEITTPSTCSLLRSMNEKKVEDGIGKLHKALELRPEYDDAMAYMNLLYREKAEYECDDPEQRQADLKAADQWVDLAIQVKKAKAEKVAQPTPQ